MARDLGHGFFRAKLVTCVTVVTVFLSRPTRPFGEDQAVPKSGTRRIERGLGICRGSLEPGSVA